MAEQLTLDLPVRAALGRADFFVSSANALALAQIDGWRDWPAGKLVLTGPAGAGKTHLAHVWATESGARIVAARDLAALGPERLAGGAHVAIEDAQVIAGDRAGEAALFHLHNMVLTEGGRLLLTARAAPSRWELALPDLASRLEATQIARIAPPDDALLSAVLLKLFADRQIAVTPAVITYLARRMERSLATAARVVDALDAAALAQGRPVSRRLAAEILARIAAGGEAGPAPLDSGAGEAQ
ncbi:chromosomal replication initiator DnaA [Rhodobacteraceae bacterium WD3A24]|nr:chromosomal replication initiator DnaA [Rhodobacteraceae bacterium WD3A24]